MSNSTSPRHHDTDYIAPRGSVANRADESMSTSGQQSPSRTKKRVEWILPQDPDAEGAEQPSTREEKIEELRRSLSNALPAHGQLSDSATETSNSPPLSQRPRSVLRSGTCTPQIPSNLDDGVQDLEVKIQSASDAQVRAHRITEDVSRDVSRDNSREVSRASSPERRSRRNKHSFFNHLFHSSDKAGSGYSTPEEMGALADSDYVPAPSKYRASGLSAFNLATLLQQLPSHSRRGSAESVVGSSRSGSPLGRGISNLVGHSLTLGAIPNTEGLGAGAHASGKPSMSRRASDDTVKSLHLFPWRPSLPRSGSSSVLDQLPRIGRHGSGWRSPRTKSETDFTIKYHIQGSAERQSFLIKLCRALMQYGAPTHRLEEYMRMSARILKTEAQFLYIPGCMIISFDDSVTHTAEMRLVRTLQGVNLGKLRDTHEVYKEVVHDKIGAREAGERLDDIMKAEDKFPVWIRVIAYGFASVTVGPFAFQARLIDLPIAFVLGCLLGFLQLVLSNQTDLYTSVFEIIAVMSTSFLARFFGSLGGGNIFCFSALAQSSIALILPGYTVLCGALELQSKSMVAGAVRLVYAVIYSLFIGFGLTMGIAIYGVIDRDASSETQCTNPISAHGYWVFFFVPAYTMCLMIINQAKWRQMPLMLVISFVGYLVNYFSALRFAGNAQVSSAFASLAIAFLANMYSRVGQRFNVHISQVGKKITTMLMSTFSPNRSKVPKVMTEPPSPCDMEMQPTMQSRPAGGVREFLRWLRNPQPAPSELTERWSTTDTGESTPSGDTTGSHPVKRVRVQYGLAAAAMLPAIFVLVPSGLSVSGSLVSGIATGNQIVQNSNGTTLTQGDVYSGKTASDSLAFGVGFGVVQIAIGITVGLFLGTLAAYPLGKGQKVWGRGQTRSGIFSY